MKTVLTYSTFKLILKNSWILFVAFVSSCVSNVITFDESKQLIISEYRIRRISITNLDTYDWYTIERKKDSLGTAIINLKNIPSSYNIYFNLRKKMDSTTNVISPNSRYEIEHTSFGNVGFCTMFLYSNRSCHLREFKPKIDNTQPSGDM